MSALYEFLVDTPEDGYIEEHGWLRGDLAATPEAAIEKMTDLVRRDLCMDPLVTVEDVPAKFQVVGKVTLRAEFEVTDEDGDEVEKLVGPAAETAAAEHGRDEEVRYVPCDPSDDGAVEWWKLELVEAVAA